MYYLTNRAVALNRKMAEAVRQVKQYSGPVASPPAAPVMPPGVNDWWIQRSLAPVYPAALDAVAQNPAVIERLGEGVEPLDDAERLYRIKNTGEPLTNLPPGTLPGSQTIEFDIKGPKGAAVVRVTATSGNVNFGGTFMAKEITVILADGTELVVPAPKEQAGTVIQ
jgi:hypothetical protein